MRTNSQDATRQQETWRLFWGMKMKSTSKRGTEGIVESAATATAPGRLSAPAMPSPHRPGSAIDPKWQWHYRALVALRGRLLQESKSKRQDVAEPIEAHSMHAADSATDEFDHDVAMTMLAREEHSLQDVEDAITRIMNGKYGVCEASGGIIPAIRLKALPWCRYTREVEQQLEDRGSATRCRLPSLVSLRGSGRNIPGTGVVTRDDSEGPRDEPSEHGVEKIAAEPTSGEGEDDEPPAAR
jgi:RNA polymerase-binding transcription factor DksA